MSEVPHSNQERQPYGYTVEELHRHLSGDNSPVESRYGLTRAECAWWAVAVLYIGREEDWETDFPIAAADYVMDRVIADDPDVLEAVVKFYGHLPASIASQLPVEEVMREC